MNQETLNKNKKWTRITSNYEDSTPGEIKKLEINETIVGLLIDKKPSKKYEGKNIYKIQTKKEEIPKVLIGTTILDDLLGQVEIGSEVRIKRVNDLPSEKANPLQDYEVDIATSEED